MPFKPINLIDAHFQISNIFNHLPVFDEIYYHGQPKEKIQYYKAIREGQECDLLCVTLIRKDEDFLWEAAEDLLERSVWEATARVRGVYNFDLLTFGIHNVANTFNCTELTHLIVNHSLKLKVGEQRLIKYCSSYGLLQKIADESWGKIIFKTSVEVFNDKPSFLFALVSRMLEAAAFSRNPVAALVNDLSATPLYNPADDKQQGFLAKLIQAQAKSSIEFPPEVYIQDKNGVRELLSQTTVSTKDHG